MNRNIVVAGAVAGLMLLSAAGGAAVMHLLDARPAKDGRQAPSMPATAARTPQAEQPPTPPPAETVELPPAPPSFAELEASYHQALGDRERGIENFFIDGGQISTPKVALLRSDEDYAHFVEYLQTYVTAAGEQHVATLQQGLTRQPQILDGSVALADLACGSSLCTLSLTGRDPAAIDDYVAAALRSPGEPVYVAMRVPMTTRGGAGIRLIFSVDSSIRSASDA